MKSIFLKTILRSLVLASAGALFAAGTASAADVYLETQSGPMSLSDGGSVPTWTYACASTLPAGATNDNCVSQASGSPRINVTAGEALNIYLTNTLGVPVSITIPGQVGGGDPVMFTDTRGRSRVQSFTAETAAGSVATPGTPNYTWSAMRPGTYLYHSATQPSLQVPMGLFGAIVVGPATGATCTAPQQPAYDSTASCYNADTLLLFSEIDTTFNERVAAAAGTPTTQCVSRVDYETNGTGGYPCTVDYRPNYFLINGAAYKKSTTTPPPALVIEYPANPDGTPNANTLMAGNKVLLRLVNAGLRSHTPTIVGLDMEMLAEDGNLYPGLAKQQSESLLPAGQTKDALITLPTADLTFALFDRMANSSKDDLPVGGMVAQLKVNNGSGGTGPDVYAVNDAYSVPEDTLPTDAASLLGSVLANDAGLNDPATWGNTVTVALGTPPSSGTVQCETSPGVFVPGMCANGTFQYTPYPDYVGPDTFTYSATFNGVSYPAHVTLTVTPVNDAPVASPDGPYTNTIGTTITVDAAHGVLGNDSDPDGDKLYALIEGTAPTGLTCGDTAGICDDGSFTYSGGPGSFTYRACDRPLALGACPGSLSNPATVTLQINPLAHIALDVRDPGGNQVSNYYWLVEEDVTWHPDPNNPDPDSLGTSFHKSHMPVVASGCVGTGSVQNGNGTTVIPLCAAPAPFNQLALPPLDPDPKKWKHYFVSILPLDAMDADQNDTRTGHTLGGASIPPTLRGTPDQDASLSVNLNSQPLPYAQISVLVFEDNSPTNGVVDGAEERPLGGFQLTLEDAGGKYGASAGIQAQDADGNPLKNWLNCFGGNPPPEGVILTCPDTLENQAAGVVGQALIKHLAQGKYGVSATAPLGSTDQWVQTSTIEGTRVIDAWVKPGEPPFMQEFGPVGQHVAIGFVSPVRVAEVNPGGGGSVSGRITNLHMSRMPSVTLWDSTTNDAFVHTIPWVGLNSASGLGPNFAAVMADDTGSFTINNVPDGDYQLVVWDKYLDFIISYRNVSVSGGNIDVGNVPVFQWFGRTEHNVFLDDGCGDPALANNGIRDLCADGELERGLPEQNINLRFRDGTVYQAFPTDTTGFVPFDQVFPFFNWLVAEVDFLRHKPTGVTVTVDGGGDVTGTGFILNPQLQDPTDPTSTSATYTGPVLTMGFQQFLGQTSLFDWGKAPYAVGENGGIAGIVYYAVTRAEANPRLGVGEPWEPGIARAKVRLYRQVPNGSGGTSLALVQETQTDSWDDSLPSNCPGYDPNDPVIVSETVFPPAKCFDGQHNFNQVRQGVFDGGYAFTGLQPGTYVVEVVPPPGYTLVKEEDVNVTFGDGYAAEFLVAGTAVVNIVPDPATILEAQALEPGIAQPPCVGEMHVVPQILSLFPSAAAAAPYAGASRPLCDRKLVTLKDQSQAAADFYLFTGAPIAGHYTGMILDDASAEFDPRSIQFGEKHAPPFVPVSFRDYNGKEISRVVSDQWGRFNGLVPSTYTAYMPSPSGYSAATHMNCVNDPGPIPDPTGAIDPATNKVRMIPDPNYNPAYSNFCYTLQYMPGSTTYLDTPVLPVSAFASGYNPLSCTPSDATPVIRQVDGTGFGPLVAPGGTLTITSLGTVTVPNPAWEGPLATDPLAAERTMTRDYGFGATPGTVTLGGAVLAVTSWTDDTIIATAPATVTAGQLVVTRANGNVTERGVTVTVSSEAALRVFPGQPDPSPYYKTIQAAVDDANPGDLILVAPGSYDEQVIMWKPVRLQGAGAPSTFLNGVKRPTDKLLLWRAKMDCLFGIGVDCTQRVNVVPAVGQVGALAYELAEAAPLTVVGPVDAGAPNYFAANASRFDGFSVTGGDTGGGIFVDAYADNLVISNNDVFGNAGSLHGGIRVGRPQLGLLEDGPYGWNNNVNIHDNTIRQNGGRGGAGGGVSIAAGSDGYIVSDNLVCGNFTDGDGGGIGHLGLSNGGTISNNRIVFNQAFNQGITVSGGGVFVGGEPSAAGALTFGSGNVSVIGNLIQGNEADAGFGGGLRAQFVNGQDVIDSIQTSGNNAGRAIVGQWYQLIVTSNTIINNVTGWEGGGVSLQDVAKSTFNTNTIAYNDSVATVGALVVGNLSTNQVAGFATANHTQALTDAIPLQNPPGNNNDTAGLKYFSNPSFNNSNIVRQNRSFHYDATTGTAELIPVLSQTSVGQCLSGALYWDMDPLLGGPTAPTTTTGAALANSYCNGGRTLITPPGPMQVAPAADEGGNAWINVRFGPLTLDWQQYVTP